VRHLCLTAARRRRWAMAARVAWCAGLSSALSAASSSAASCSGGAAPLPWLLPSPLHTSASQTGSALRRASSARCAV
jgi:hypothetical protein